MIHSLPLVCLFFLLAGCAGPPEVARTRVPCGDGYLADAEECDDHNRTAGDGCSPSCRLEYCGDYALGLGEDCDDGPYGSSGCTGDCLVRHCGNGVHEPELGEACDLGLDGGAGCSPECELLTCGDGALAEVPSEETCDDGNLENADGCDSSCRIPDANGLNTFAWDCRVVDEDLTVDVELRSSLRSAPIVDSAYYDSLGFAPQNPECDPVLVDGRLDGSLTISPTLLAAAAAVLEVDAGFAPAALQLTAATLHHQLYFQGAVEFVQAAGAASLTVPQLPRTVALDGPALVLPLSPASFPTVSARPWEGGNTAATRLLSLRLVFSHSAYDEGIGVTCTAPAEALDFLASLPQCDQCPGGEQACGYPGQTACIGNDYCESGCCVPFTIP